MGTIINTGLYRPDWFNGPGYDTNSFLTSKDKALVEFAGGADDLSTAEYYEPSANLLAMRIGEDRHDGLLTGDVTQSYLNDLLQETRSSSWAASSVGRVPPAVIYKSLSYFTPPADLPKGAFYADGTPAYFGNDMLTDADKKVIEAVGGSSDLVVAEKNPDVMFFAGAIASARYDGTLKGPLTTDYLQNLAGQQKEILREIQNGMQPAGMMTVSLSVIDKAIAYLENAHDHSPVRERIAFTTVWHVSSSAML